MDIIYRHLCVSPRFRNKLYPYFIDQSMTIPANSSTFDFEGLSQDVTSGIQGYVNVSSARNMLLISNAFHFGTRDCLVRCHKSVFEMYRNRFIEQLVPFVLLILCYIWRRVLLIRK
jgi:hypothetical protein